MSPSKDSTIERTALRNRLNSIEFLFRNFMILSMGVSLLIEIVFIMKAAKMPSDNFPETRLEKIDGICGTLSTALVAMFMENNAHVCVVNNGQNTMVRSHLELATEQHAEKWPSHRRLAEQTRLLQRQSH